MQNKIIFFYTDMKLSRYKREKNDDFNKILKTKSLDTSRPRMAKPLPWGRKMHPNFCSCAI